MQMVRLIYASKISSSFTGNGDIDHILDQSKVNNPELTISGILCYSNDYFLQCLEGSRKNVNQLYHHILKDKRHYDPSILDYKVIAKREFGQWGMTFIPPSKISGEIIQKYSGEIKFNPYTMSGDSCFELLKEIYSFNQQIPCIAQNSQ